MLSIVGFENASLRRSAHFPLIVSSLPSTSNGIIRTETAAVGNRQKIAKATTWLLTWLLLDAASRTVAN